MAINPDLVHLLEHFHLIGLHGSRVERTDHRRHVSHHVIAVVLEACNIGQDTEGHRIVHLALHPFLRRHGQDGHQDECQGDTSQFE